MRRPVLLVLVPLALSGCGATAGTLDAGSARSLGSELAAVRVDAAHGSRAQALDALSAFAARVETDARSGRLTAAEHSALRTGIARVRAALAATAPTPSARTRTVTTVTATSPATTQSQSQSQPLAPAPGPKKDHAKSHGGKHGGSGGQGGD